MKLSDNTILITGGTSGIGLALATKLRALGNTVIVTAHSQGGLGSVAKCLPDVHAIQSDVSDPTAIAKLYQRVTRDFPSLNVLINNAGIMRKINLRAFDGNLQDITREVDTNLSGTIRMTMQFLTHLKTQQRAAIVNVSSGLAFVPTAMAPVYCATKAATHSFTQSLRIQLKDTSVTVFELAPPLTETHLFRGDFRARDVARVRPMDVETFAQRAIVGLGKSRLEIRPGLSNFLKIMSRVAPNFMLHQLSKSVDQMLAISPDEREVRD